jgi:hypothetical protein
MSAAGIRAFLPHQVGAAIGITAQSGQILNSDFGSSHAVRGLSADRELKLQACRLLADLFADSGGKRRKNAENLY